MRRGAAVAILLLALVPSVYVAWQARDMAHLGYFHDDALYAVAAKSLAEGQGYRIASLPGAPYQTKYPPLYPLLLSTAFLPGWPLAQSLTAALVLSWMMVPLFVLASRWTFADLGVIGWEAVLLSALIAVNPFTCTFGISLMTELPFAILVAGTLFLTEKARHRTVLLAAAAGTVAGLAYLTRSAGIVLLISGPLIFLANRRFRHAVAYCATMLPAVVGWTVWTHAHRAANVDRTLLYYTDYLGFYAQDLRNLPFIAWHNLDSMVGSMGGLILFNPGDGFAGKSLARVLAVASVAGAYRLIRRSGALSYGVFAVLYLAEMLVWNYMPDHRFLMPLFPLLVAGFASEVKHIAAAVVSGFRTQGIAARAVAGGIATAFAAFAVALVFETTHTDAVSLGKFVARHRAQFVERQDLYAWIRANTPKEARICAQDDPHLYLYTERRACRLVISPMVNYRGQPQELADAYASLPEFARAERLDYVLVTRTDLHNEIPAECRRTAERAFRHDLRLRLMFESQAGCIYRVN